MPAPIPPAPATTMTFPSSFDAIFLASLNAAHLTWTLAYIISLQILWQTRHAAGTAVLEPARTRSGSGWRAETCLERGALTGEPQLCRRASGSQLYLAEPRAPLASAG